MNWHLSAEDRPSDDNFYAIVFKRKNRYYIDTDYTYFESDKTFLRNDDYGNRFELKETIAWISEDEILNDFREFFKQNKKHIGKDNKHGSDSLQDAETNTH